GRNVDSATEAGAVLLVATMPSPGSGETLLLTQDTHAGSTAAETGDRFGSALLFHDDDGNGVPDLFVGAPFEDWIGQIDTGVVSIRYAGSTALVSHRGDIEAGDFLGGTLTARMFFGSALAARSPQSGQSPQVAIG